MQASCVTPSADGSALQANLMSCPIAREFSCHIRESFYLLFSSEVGHQWVLVVFILQNITIWDTRFHHGDGPSMQIHKLTFRWWFVARGLLRRTATRRSRHDEGWFRCVSGRPNDKPMDLGWFRGTQLSDKAIEDVWRANGTLEIWPICFSSHQVFVSGFGHSQPFHLFAKRVIITVVVIHVLWISAPVLNRLCQNTHEGACCNFSPIWRSPLGQVKPSPVWNWAAVFLHWNHWACCSTL